MAKTYALITTDPLEEQAHRSQEESGEGLWVHAVHGRGGPAQAAPQEPEQALAVLMRKTKRPHGGLANKTKGEGSGNGKREGKEEGRKGSGGAGG